jgi:hypothetical protein
MCSTSVQRIAEIGKAIDELAALAAAAEARNGRASKGLPAGEARAGEARAGEARAGEARAGEARAGEPRASDSDQFVIRLAELWAQLAELDPEVARRLPTYEA